MGGYLLTGHIPFYHSLRGRLLSAFFLVAFIAVLGVGLAAYIGERETLKTQVIAQLTAVIDLKKEQIMTWLEARQADVHLLAINRLNQDHFIHILDPNTSIEHRAELAAFLTDNILSLQQSHTGYSEIALTDLNGIVVVATNPELIGKPTRHQQVFQQALATPTGVVMQDIHMDHDTGQTMMAFGHVIYAMQPETDQSLPDLVGVAYIIVDMEETIYPLIHSWPGMSKTSETLLIRADGEETVYLNNLRFDDQAALHLRIPATANWATSAHLAARGEEGVILTNDYRGMPVLAAYRYIPEIGWGFVAKSDMHEAFGPVNQLAHRIGLIALAVFGVTGLVSLALSRTLIQPLAQLVSWTQVVAKGDLHAKIHLDQVDEIGVLADSFQQMLQSLDQRQQEVASVEAQLRQSQKMEAIGQLAGGVAHDFNNMLTVITGYCDLTLMAASLDHRLKKNLQEIREAGQRAAALTNQLLAFSRKQVLQPRILNLNQVVSGMEEMLHRLIGEDVMLTVSLNQQLGQVMADPGQIEQVILNLVINARDAMPGGGHITIETHNISLDETYAGQRIEVQPGDYVLLLVNDTGIGMDEETLNRIFEPFFTTKEEGKGTGLGLSTVYGIIRQSEGDLRVDSELGYGTTFKIYLPRVESEIKTPISPETPSLKMGHETILLVEDETSLRHLTRTILEKQGYQVIEAVDGQEALIRCQAFPEPIHLLLTDMIMPGGLNGRQLADQAQILRPRMKVLYMSGYTDRAILQRTESDPELTLLQKPFPADELLRHVQVILEKRPVKEPA